MRGCLELCCLTTKLDGLCKPFAGDGPGLTTLITKVAYSTENAEVELLKLVSVMADGWRRFGLALLNALARSGIRQKEVHAYGKGRRQSLDWYPISSDAPTVVFFYGGDWQSGNKADFRFVADTLCRMGNNVVVADHRLYPGHGFAAILDDARDALNFSLLNLSLHGPVILMGHSSGAQLAALLTLDESLIDQPGRIKGLVGISGPYDFFPFTDAHHWDLFGPEEAYPRSQPVNFVRSDAPMLYLLHGADDTRVRRGNSKSLMEKQREAGGRAEREVYEGMGHVDAVISFSRIHRRKSKLIRDIQLFIETQTSEEHNSGTK